AQTGVFVGEGIQWVIVEDIIPLRIADMDVPVPVIDILVIFDQIQDRTGISPVDIFGVRPGYVPRGKCRLLARTRIDTIVRPNNLLIVIYYTQRSVKVPL